MRRLVADLLLLARTDVGRVVRREPCDLAQIVVEAAGELGPVSADHEIVLDVHPAIVEASRDELHRLTINLLENALRHTPPGTRISVWTSTADGQAMLVVQDDGPGVPPELACHPVRALRPRRRRPRRLLRPRPGHRPRRGRVPRRHGHPRDRREGTGARFVVRLPAASDLDDDGQHHRPALQTVVD